MGVIEWAESGWTPDTLIRQGIRYLLRRRIAIDSRVDAEVQREQFDELLAELRDSPIAVDTSSANAQHYEVPAEFFNTVLGPRLKYSCCQYDGGDESLEQAEEAMLATTCERAVLRNGQQILELGCGWGSLTVWMAEQYRDAQITAVSNSRTQKEFIDARCRRLGLNNVRVITADMCDFDIDEQFDRVISIEMFEHMRNYETLLKNVSRWLKADGKLFVHIFCHRELAYLFETEGDINWMGRHFFTGGIMPSEDLLLFFQENVSIERQWRVSGQHYYRTCEHWLENLDRRREDLVALFEQDLEPREARIQLQRWRMFFMACGELFRFDRGNQWYVAHYLFRNRAPQPESVDSEPATREAVV